jgi:hypothetical protein
VTGGLLAGGFSTFKIELFDVHESLPSVQEWNTNYEAAKKIFGKSLTSKPIRSSIRAQHAKLYHLGSRKRNGTVTHAKEFFDLISYGIRNNAPSFFTYVIAE